MRDMNNGHHRVGQLEVLIGTIPRYQDLDPSIAAVVVGSQWVPRR